MDIETVKVIAETVKTLGQQGGEVFLWWIAADFVKTLLGILAAIFCAYNLLKALISALNGEAETTLLQLRGMLGVGSPGELTARECREIVAKVAELKADKKN